MKITYLGIRNSRFELLDITKERSKVFAYEVELNGHKFDYSTGLGWSKLAHRRPGEDYFKLSIQDQEIFNKTVSYKLKGIWGQGYHWRQQPTERDILECLQTDVEAGLYSFNDFCNNCGYSTDSIKALNTYRACMEIAEKLRGFDFASKLKSEASS